MSRLALAVLGLGLAACSSGRPDQACSLAGEWWADLGLYDGTLRLTPDGPDHFRVELIGKGVQTGSARWLHGRLELSLPSEPTVGCTPSADCRSLPCDDDGPGPGGLRLRRR